MQDTNDRSPIRFDPAAAGPLDGIRVLDLTRLVAGNMLSLQLADFGADVIKVEPPSGDPLRDWRDGGKELHWKTYARNKRSIVLNFRHAAAKAALLRLARDRRRVHREFSPRHAGGDGPRPGRAARRQSGPDHRAGVGLRPDRPLCAAAGLRHAGRSHERLCGPHRLCGPRAGAAAARARRHDRRPLRRIRRRDGAARARPRHGARPGHRPVASRIDVLGARAGGRDLPADRRRQGARRQRLQHVGAAQRLSLPGRAVRRPVGLDRRRWRGGSSRSSAAPT